MKILMFLIALVWGGSVLAQDHNEILGLLEGLDEDASAMDTFLEHLEDGDASTQAALFGRVMELEITSPLRELVLNRILSGEDKALRSLALWEVVKQRSEMTLRFGPEEELPAGATRTAIEKLGYGFGTQMFRVDHENKVIEIYRTDKRYPVVRRENSMSVNGTTINFVIDQMAKSSAYEFEISGSLSLNDEGDALHGEMTFYIPDSHQDYKDLGGRWRLPIYWVIR